MSHSQALRQPSCLRFARLLENASPAGGLRPAHRPVSLWPTKAAYVPTPSKCVPPLRATAHQKQRRCKHHNCHPRQAKTWRVLFSAFGLVIEAPLWPAPRQQAKKKRYQQNVVVPQTSKISLPFQSLFNQGQGTQTAEKSVYHGWYLGLGGGDGPPRPSGFDD